MSEFQDEEQIDAKLSKLKPLSVEEFCQIWVPLLYGIDESSSKYLKACRDLIIRLSGNTKQTVKNWFWNPKSVPSSFKAYLGAVDQLWRLEKWVETLRQYILLQDENT